MRFSTIDADNISWTTAALYDNDGEAIPTANRIGIRILVIINDSATDRIFRINGGAPFLVRDGNEFSYGLLRNGTAVPLPLKIEMDSGTFTGITIYGD